MIASSNNLKIAITIALLSLALITKGQDVFVPKSYSNSFDSPVIVTSGQILQTMSDGYFINERRYEFYKKLHRFANDAEFKGHEKEILDGFGGFLSDSDEILRKMTENTSKLELSAEELKKAQDAVDALSGQVDELARQNKALRDKINQPVRQKKKWAVPVLLGVVAGITIGVLIQ